MIRLKQFNFLHIEDLDETCFPLPYHSQNYHELIYIYEGQGTHLLNNNKISYYDGDLFLISQDDVHHLEAKTSTRIITIKFTSDYFRSNNGLYNPDNLINNKALKEIKLLFDQKEIVFIKQIIDNILLYSSNKENEDSPVIFYQILSILELIRKIGTRQLKNSINDILEKKSITTYIHQHIFEPSKIRVKTISLYFNIADSYFSSYFKRSFGISYRGYINEYRLKLIERRLTLGYSSIKEIAHEFGFNDESHFSHYYKNARGITPSFYNSKNKLPT